MPRESRTFCAPRRRAALVVICLIGLWTTRAGAQSSEDWGDEDWSSSSAESVPAPAPLSGTDPSTAWSLRMGMGFIDDPTAFLLNFELPYQFDRFVSAGPMIQVGLHEDKLVVAPTANVGVRLPDLPGTRFDRFHPGIFAGIGFAVIEKDERQGDNRSAGFLINTGFGVDFDLSRRTSVGSRMIFNFLPAKTLGERFFYSWEIIGLRIAF